MPGKYRLEIKTSAKKALENLPVTTQERLIDKLLALSNNPRPFGCKKLLGTAYYRIRSGDYRIIYSINDEKLNVLVIDVGHRRDVYRGY